MSAVSETTTTIERARVTDRHRRALRWRTETGEPSVRWWVASVGTLGVLAAAGVGYLTSKNHQAVPVGAAVAFRVAIILALLAAGIYARTSRIQLRMGRLLVTGGFLSAIWLLNGSSNSLAFSVGLLTASLAVAGFAYLMVVHPTGRLQTVGQRRFFASVGGGLLVFWVINTVTSSHPEVPMALVRCGSSCPRNTFFIGSLNPTIASALRVLIVVCWLALAWAPPWLLARRARYAPVPLRRSLLPVRWISTANAAFLTAYLLARVAGGHLANELGTGYVGFAVVVPLAILFGLWLQRLFMGRALADFVGKLARFPRADPQTLMAVTLRDPSLRIVYRRPFEDGYIDSSGTPVDRPEGGPARALTWVMRGNRSLAAVTYDADLADQEQFVQAAAAAALMRLERVQLEADLAASTSQLAASRTRLVEAAYSERQRIERDLHDGIQQDLLGARLKLDMAAEAIREDQQGAERTVAAVGRQIDDVLASLRSLARGIYPSLLNERGIVEALKSAARRSPVPVSVTARAVGRYPKDVEVALYFSCLEAVQNAVKHAGAEARIAIRLWGEPGQLCFQVQDDGVGFDPAEIVEEHGLLNMRDRIEAVGGSMAIESRPGNGTTVGGRIDVAALATGSVA